MFIHNSRLENSRKTTASGPAVCQRISVVTLTFTAGFPQTDFDTKLVNFFLKLALPVILKVWWPTTVTAKPNPHGKNKIPHGKPKNLTANPKTSRQKQNTSRQTQKAHGKNKIPHAKTKNLTAKTKTSRQTKNLTAKPNTSQQKQNSFGFAVSICFCREVFGFCSEVFGFAVRYFVSAVRFLVLP